nr:uncharacterized protein LOC128694387 [Cherax quadricarinatus]
MQKLSTIFLLVSLCCFLTVFWYFLHISNTKYTSTISASVSQVRVSNIRQTSVSGSVSQASVSGSVNQSPACSALFTITDVPGEEIFQQYIRYLTPSLDNMTDSDSWPAQNWLTTKHDKLDQEDTPAVTDVRHMLQSRQVAAEALAGVTQVLLKRKLSTGVTIEDYNKLSQLLPNLLTFRKTENHRNGEEQTEEPTVKKVEAHKDGEPGNIWSKTMNNRLGLSRGVLPFVPCVVAPYDASHAITCINKRLENNNTLRIHFLGDSKIRDVFKALLRRTDSEFRYMIHYSNVTERWSVAEPRLQQKGLLWSNMVATTYQYPHLRISFSFRTFMSVTDAEIMRDDGLRLLKNWATDAEDRPHLLIVGYNSWMLHADPDLHNTDILSFLLVMHQLTVSLLEQISQKTRVLMLTQSRLRSHGHFKLYNNRIAFSNANFDWSDMMFQQLLHH